ncbi:MAG: YdcH family protein [Alphaproteobacteria bacterium]|nr:YdcH family protein [Alphaproteobacteria bacterium]
MATKAASGDYLIQRCRDHAALQAEIDGELSRPRPDYSIVRDLTRRKLQLKDQIARLNMPISASAGHGIA